MANCFLCNKSLGFLNTPMFGKGNTKDGFGMCTSCHMNLVTNGSDIAHKLKSSTKDEIEDLLNKLAQSNLELQQLADKNTLQKKEQKEHQKQVEQLEKEHIKQEKKEAFKQKVDEHKNQQEIFRNREIELREVVKKLNPIAASKREIAELPSILMMDEIIEKVSTGYLKEGKGVSGHGLLVATNFRLIFIDKSMLGIGIKMEDFPYDKITSIAVETGFLKGELKIICSGNIALINVVNGAKQLSEFIRQKTLTKQQSNVTIQQSNPQIDILGQIEKLADLKSKGILTSEEFDVQKSKLLEKL